MNEKRNANADNSVPNADSQENHDTIDRIVETGSTFVANGNDSFYCLSVIGQIEGHYVLDNTQKTTKYDHLIPLLVGLEESSKVDGILIVLNTMGGDVEAGLAIAEVIASLTKPTVSVVLGGGHSIGVPLAVSARLSFIVPSATMTIHPVRTTGTVINVPQTYHYLSDMQNRIVRFITDHSRVREDVLRNMMMCTEQLTNDIGSVIDGQTAVSCGLIDRVGGIGEALAALRTMCYGNRGDENECGDSPDKVTTQSEIQAARDNAAPVQRCESGYCNETGAIMRTDGFLHPIADYEHG